MFVVLALIISFIAALVGGIVCASIARSSKAPLALAILILVCGAIRAVMQLTAPDPGPRPSDVSPFKVAQNARQPAWYAIALPIVGAAGVMAGARLRGTRKRPHA